MAGIVLEDAEYRKNIKHPMDSRLATRTVNLSRFTNLYVGFIDQWSFNFSLDAGVACFTLAVQSASGSGPIFDGQAFRTHLAPVEL